MKKNVFGKVTGIALIIALLFQIFVPGAFDGRGELLAKADGSLFEATVTANGITTGYSNVEQAWIEAVKASVTNPATFKLCTDWIAGEDGFHCTDSNGDEYGTDYGRLHIATDSIDITVDLNGHTISRNLAAPEENGQVFRIEAGTLTIDDTSDGKNGKITGGNNEGNGGGVYIDSGTINLKGGNIYNNHAVCTKLDDGLGGGIYAHGGTVNICGGSITKNSSAVGGGAYIGIAKFNMSAGSVAENHAVLKDDTYYEGKGEGGGLLLSIGSDAHVSGGSIWGNISDGDGGGIYCDGISDLIVSYGSQFTFSGGSIRDNIAKKNGGGIYWYSPEPMLLLGGSITGNSAPSYCGGGVYSTQQGKKIYVGGSIKVTDNTAYTGNPVNNDDNIYLSSSDCKIYQAKEQDYYVPDCPLTVGAKIGISAPYDLVYNRAEVAGASSEFTLDCSDYITADNVGYSLEWTVEDSDCMLYLAQKEGGSDSANVMEVSTGGASTLYSNFSKGWIAALKASKSSKTTIKLLEDWIPPSEVGFKTLDENGDEYGSDNGRLHMATDEMELIVDLNGCTISRNLDTATEHGQVFRIEDGSLTITDTSPEQTGKITGAHNSGNGGAFYMDNGSLYIEGGKISGNRCTGYGGGIYWYSSGTLCLTGGEICDNTAKKSGGGVYVDYGDIYVGDSAVVKDNVGALANDNICLSSVNRNINNAAGQKSTVPNAPLSEGAQFGINLDDDDDTISGSSSKFEIDSYAFFKCDEPYCQIRAVYDEDGGNHTYKLYYTREADSKFREPDVEGVTMKNTELLKGASVDQDTKTITIEAALDQKSDFQSVALDSLISCALNDDGSYIADSSLKTDFTSPATFMVFADNGTYVLYTVSVKWPSCSHTDADGDFLCDLCDEYILTDFGIASYNGQTKTAMVIIAEPGTYCLVFAHYENGQLSDFESCEVTAQGAGDVAVSNSKGFDLVSGDKILLWKNTSDCTPLCKALAIK